jgi:hypothetical protein
MRFWIQSHLLAAPLLVPGVLYLWSMATGRESQSLNPNPTLVLVGAAALVLAQGALHLRVSDQSSNRYFEQYARSILRPMPKDAMILSRGDNVVNTVRYLQVPKNAKPNPD